VQRIWIFITLTLLLWLSGTAVGQRRGATTLSVRVAPESQVEPSQVPVRFVVSADGRDDVAGEPTLVTARVRSVPGRQIHLMAAVGGVTGPSDGAPSARFEWSGSAVQASAGARTASCANGAFADGASQDLVTGWYQSGSLTCSFSFRLANARELLPGTYTAIFALTLETR
jgi:hypothetical protein